MYLKSRSNGYALWLSLSIVMLLVVLLYQPFFGSTPVFDDHNLITNLRVYDSAQELFSRFPRTFPYFSIGLVHVLSGGDLQWNRLVGALLHASVVLALYFLLIRVLAEVPAVNDRSKRWTPVFVCLWVAINPVAVYAAAYLVQRTIVLATLFAILSTNLYLRAQQRGRNADLFSGALLAGLAMMCKEHALLVPAAACALTPFVCRWNRTAVKRALGYLAMSSVFSLWVVFHSGKDLIGTSYEIYSPDIWRQLLAAGLDFPGGAWALSAATQLLLFWKYAFLWIVPNPRWMSADLRVDFVGLWSSVWGYGGVAATLAVLLGAAMRFLRSRAKDKVGQLSAVLLFAAISFLVELSVVRLQEPFVLYRSYLWMPAYAVLLCLVLTWCEVLVVRHGILARSLFWGVALFFLAGLFPMAQDRLRSFSSDEALWDDALLKLVRDDVPGADRIYYNLAGEAFKREEFAVSLRMSEKTVAQSPASFRGYVAMGTSLVALGELDAALRAFDQAQALQPPQWFLGNLEFKRCSVFAARKDRVETIACLKRSAAMGYDLARFSLQRAGVTE